MFLLSEICLIAQGTRLLREPTISQSSIVFVHVNDLWKIDHNGGNAVWMTGNIGREITGTVRFSRYGSQVLKPTTVYRLSEPTMSGTLIPYGMMAAYFIFQNATL